jgi:hypothetical protein
MTTKMNGEYTIHPGELGRLRAVSIHRVDGNRWKSTVFSITIDLGRFS